MPKPQLIERITKLKEKLHRRMAKMAPWLDLPSNDRAKTWRSVPQITRTMVLEDKLIKEPKPKKADAAGGAAAQQRRGYGGAAQLGMHPGVTRVSGQSSRVRSRLLRGTYPVRFGLAYLTSDLHVRMRLGGSV